MPGMFDDLIPRGAGAKPTAKPGLSFDDLIPTKKAGKVMGATATFDAAVPLMDEFKAAGVAGINALTGRGSFGENWTAERARQAEAEQGFTAEHPIAANALRTYGAATTLAVPGGAGVKAMQSGNLARNALTGAVVAGGTGAAYAATDRGTVEERLRAAADASHNPVTLALGAAGGALGTAGKPKVKTIPGKAPTLPELTSQRKAAYKAVVNSGHRYDAQGFAGMVADVKASLAKEQFDPRFHTKAQLLLDDLDARVKAGAAPTLAQLDNLRKFANKNVKGDSIHLRGAITRGIDDFIDSQGGGAAALVGKARDLFKRESKVAEVTKAVEKSSRQAKRSGSGGNYDNATRIKMDGILEKNPFLTAQEKAALENIVMGDRGQNALRAYGKTSPLTGGLSAQFNLYGGILTGGVGGLLHSAPSSVAKIAADNITRTKVNRLLDLMAAGGTREQLIAIQNQARTVQGPAGSALQKMVAARLARVSGVGGTLVAAPRTAAAQPERRER